MPGFKKKDVEILLDTNVELTAPSYNVETV